MLVKINRKARPKGRQAMIGTLQWTGGADVHANQKRPTGARMAPMQHTGRRASGGGWVWVWPEGVTWECNWERERDWKYEERKGLRITPEMRPTPIPRKERPDSPTLRVGELSAKVITERYEMMKGSLLVHPRVCWKTIGKAVKNKYNLRLINTLLFSLLLPVQTNSHAINQRTVDWQAANNDFCKQHFKRPI